MKRINIIDAMLASGCIHSKTEARRAIAQRAVTVNGVEVRDFDTTLEGEVIIRIGKQIERVVRVDDIVDPSRLP